MQSTSNQLMPIRRCFSLVG